MAFVIIVNNISQLWINCELIIELQWEGISSASILQQNPDTVKWLYKAIYYAAN